VIPVIIKGMLAFLLWGVFRMYRDYARQEEGEEGETGIVKFNKVVTWALAILTLVVLFLFLRDLYLYTDL